MPSFPAIPGPWRLAAGGYTPAEAVGELRESTVLLGRWGSPAGFPWVVHLTRTAWFRDPLAGAQIDERDPDAAPAAEPLGDGVPALLLVPLPWLRPSPGVERLFDDWLANPAVPTPRVGPGRPRWSQVEPGAPTSVLDCWEATRVAGTLGPFAADGKARHSVLGGILARSPWLLLTSSALLAEAARDLRLPADAGPLGTALAARGAAGSKGWLSGRPGRRRGTTGNPASVGAFEYLRRRGKAPLAAAAFVEGEDDPSPTGTPDVCRRHSEWNLALRDEHVSPMLVPLSHEGWIDDEPDLGVWALHWLAEGPVRSSLWSVFGRSVQAFRWYVPGADDPRLRRGTRIATISGWAPTLEPTPRAKVAAYRAEWERTDDVASDDASGT